MGVDRVPPLVLVLVMLGVRPHPPIVWVGSSLRRAVLDGCIMDGEESEFRVGTIVTDDKGADVPGLIVEAPAEPAAEYVVASSASGARITLADRYERIPTTDPVYVLVFDPLLRRSYPNWQSDQTQAALAAYRSGSFRSAAKVRPESVLTRLEEIE